MRFSANRSLVAVERASGPVTIFDSVTGKERFTIERPKAHSSAFAFSPDADWLAAIVPSKTNSAAHMVKFFSTADGSGDLELKPGRGQVLANAHALAISQDGKRLAVSSAHNFAPNDRFRSRIHRWVRNVVGAAWEELPPFEWQEGTVEGLRFTADGGELLAVSGAQSGAAVAWKWDTSEQWRKAETMFVPLDLLATSEGVDIIGGWDNKLNRPALWSWPRRPDGTREGRPAEPLRVRPGPVRLASLAASRDGQTLAVATRGGKRAPWEQRAVIRLIDAKSEDDRAILLDHTDWALDLAFDATGKELMSASKDGTVRSWKLP